MKILVVFKGSRLNYRNPYYSYLYDKHKHYVSSEKVGKTFSAVVQNRSEA